MHASCFVQNFLPEKKIIFTEINFPDNSSFCLALSLYSIWLQYLLSEIKRKTPTHTTEYRAHHTGIPDPLILQTDGCGMSYCLPNCAIRYQHNSTRTNIHVPIPTSNSLCDCSRFTGRPNVFALGFNQCFFDIRVISLS